VTCVLQPTRGINFARDCETYTALGARILSATTNDTVVPTCVFAISVLA
jgi:hypothetical protein